MKRTFAIVLSSVVAAILLLLFVLPTPSSHTVGTAVTSSRVSAYLVVENVYLANSDGKRTTSSLLLSNGIIQQIGAEIEIPDGADVIDATGLTAIPGLIDSHTHSYGSALEDALRFGVTTSVDMFSPPSILGGSRESRDVISPVTKADLYSAGMMATVAGGHGTQFGIPIETLSTSSNVSQWVRARKDEGSDFIKLVYMPYQSSIPSLDRAMAKAVIEAAHEEGLMALAHISTQQAAMDMVTDGIDGLVHVFADEPVSDEFLALAIKNKVFVIPTLAVIASVAQQDNPMKDRGDIQKWLSPMQRQTLSAQFPVIGDGFNFGLALGNVKKLHRAGVRILAGSDAPNPGTAHGVSLHHEMSLLVKAGFTPAEAVRAATELPVKVFNLTGRGSLLKGMRADLLLIQGNPYQNIGASLQIKQVIKNGYVIARNETEIETAPQLATSMLGSFDTDLAGPDGFSWAATHDGMMGGGSTAAIRRIERSAKGYALAVTAEVKAGFAYPWAGAGLGSASQSAVADVSKFSKIVFDVKGAPGRYRFMLFSGMGAGAPPTQEFDVSANWQTVSLPLKKFAGFNPKTFSMLSIVPGSSPQAVEYVIDEVRFEE